VFRVTQLVARYFYLFVPALCNRRAIRVCALPYGKNQLDKVICGCYLIIQENKNVRKNKASGRNIA